MGGRHQRRRPEQRARPRVLHLERGVLDGRVPYRWAAPGCRSRHLRRRSQALRSGVCGARAVARRAKPPRSPRRRERRQLARYVARDSRNRVRWYDAQWNDDVHHGLHAAATGESGGYYGDYVGDLSRLGRALSEGFAFQGEPFGAFDGRARGERSGHLPPTAFVSFLQNHDQIGNRAFGERIGALADPVGPRRRLSLSIGSPSTTSLHGRGMERGPAVSVLLRLS